MSNFLARLVERSRADVRSEIRPRLPSAFETGLAVAREDAAPPEEFAAQMAASTAPPNAREEAPPTVYRGPLVAGEIAPRGEGGETQRRPEPPAAAAPRAPPVRPQAEPEPLAGPSPAAAVPERPRASLRAIPIQPSIVRTEEQRRESPSSGTGTDGNGAGEAAPIVRVSIGRIEVRAITEAPPPPPAVRRPAAPRLSLDEYLRERARGER
ncbi:hypothetical protein BH23GEM7_BH23GEM7_23950 [soil metagenome]|nr:hypothetical protein [Gemmatimonadota bacterium]